MNLKKRAAVKNPIDFFTTLFVKDKKGISPVVATALLLVVAVVAVISFQGWFSTYSSGLFGATEQQSSSSLNTQIDTVIGDKLYFKNGKSENISVSSIKINGVDCSVVTNLTSGMNEINLTACTNNLPEISEVVVYTQNGVYSKSFYVKSSTTAAAQALNCSSLGLAGGDWVTVPGNAILGTVDFCVMKFEPKFVNYTGKSNTDSYNTWNWGTATGDKSITSSASGGPVAYINQTDAEIACQSLGANYHLISDPQWVTIARSAELNSQNWNSSQVYSGSMMRGHSDGAPYSALSVTNVNDGYDQTGQSSPSIERRTLVLGNNETIWDIGGNVYEWTSDTLSTSGVLNSSLGMGTGAGWVEWNTIFSSYNYLRAANISLTSANGIGQVYYDGNTASDGGNTHAFLRGGVWNNGVNAGAFCLYLGLAPMSSNNIIGFRCTYNP